MRGRTVAGAVALIAVAAVAFGLAVWEPPSSTSDSAWVVPFPVDELASLRVVTDDGAFSLNRTNEAGHSVAVEALGRVLPIPAFRTLPDTDAIQGPPAGVATFESTTGEHLTVQWYGLTFDGEAFYALVEGRGGVLLVPVAVVTALAQLAKPDSAWNRADNERMN